MEASKKILETLYDSIEDIVLVTNSDYEIEHINRKGEEVFNKNGSSSVGKKCYQVICHSKSPDKNCPLLCLKKNINPIDNRIIKSSDKYFRVKALIIKDEDGKEKFIDVLHDVTEFIKKEQTLQNDNEEYLASIEELEEKSYRIEEERKKFEHLFSNMNSAFAYHEIITDKKGKPCDYRFLECNTKFEKLTGLKKKNIIGKTVLEVLPNTEKYWIENFGKVALQGKSIEFTNYSNELNKYYETRSYSPQKGFFAVTFNDVTERELIKSKLENKNKEYEIINKELEDSLERTQQANNRNEEAYSHIESLLEGAKEVLEFNSFETTARKLFDSCKKLTGATSGYVALLNEDGDENEVLFLDSGGLPCFVDESLPMPIRGLRSDAYHFREAVYENNFMNSEHVKFMPEGHMVLRNVLFAPLVINNKAVGLIGLANKPTDFTNNDKKIVSAFGEQAAIALNNSRNKQSLEESNKKLKISKERFQLMMDATSDGLWDWSIKEETIYYSPGWKRMLGYTEQELPNEIAVWEKLTHPDDVKKSWQVFEELKQGKRKDFEVESRMKHKSGYWVWILSRAKMLKDKVGEPYRLIGSHVDISRIKLQEEKLNKLNTDINLIYEYDPAFIVLKDTQNNILRVSNKVVEMTGLPKEKIEGRSSKEIYPELADQYYKDDLEVIESKTPKRGIVEELIEPNGKKQWLLTDKIPIIENNEVKSIILFSTDITTLKRSEINLQEKKEEYEVLNVELNQTNKEFHKSKINAEENQVRLSKLFDNMNSGVAIYKSINNGSDFEIIGYNKAAEKITKIKSNDVIGKTLLTEFPKMIKSPLFKALQEVDNTGKDLYLEPFYYKDAKREGWRENNIYKLSKDEIVAVFSDVTESVNNRRNKQLESNVSKEFAMNSEKVVFHNVLEHLLNHFNCEFGYIGFINGKGDLECPTMTYKIWDKCQMPDKSMVFPKEGWAGAWGENLKTGKTILKNEQLNVPMGHIKLNNTLITVLSKGNTIIGQIVLANKSEDFNQSDKISIEHIGKYMSPLLMNTLHEINYKLKLEQHNVRLESLLRIAKFNTTSKQELLDYALNEAINLTESKIGYIYSYNEKTKQFILNSWSKDVMKECQVMNPQTTYDLDSTGCWGEVVRQKKPIVINDYAAPNNNKNGTPEGHATLRKFMSVPVIINNKLVAVAGVANKKADYTQTDENQLLLLMDNVWNVCERLDLVERLKTQKDALEKSKQKIEAHTGNLTEIIELNKTGGNKLSEIIDLALEKSLKLTHSNIGFLGFVNSDETEVNIHAWSKSAMEKCMVKDLSFVFNVAKAGIWGEAIRNKQPFVLNEYKNDHPLKKGTPKGHVPIKNFLAIPVIENKKAVAIIALGNKKEDYDAIDVNELQILADNVWYKIKQQKYQEEIIHEKEKAEKADRLKSAFLANMSHEIRTPLNGLMGFSDVMASKKNLSESDRVRYADIIKQSGDQLLHIVNDVLDISAIESGTLEVNKKLFEINNVLFSIYKLFELKKQNTNSVLELKFKRALGNITLENDENRLIQIFTNLLDNALKFTHEGSVEFGVMNVKKRSIEFFVKDTGIGIDNEQEQVIFDRFRQAEISSNRLYGGNGLGLSIVKELLSLMGGEIWVESEVNKGSCFYFSLPYAAPGHVMDENNSDESHFTEEITSNYKLNILVVEDDFINQEYMREMLSDLDINLTMVANGNEGIQQAKLNNFDIILMDIRLPDINGFDATKEIRKFNSKVPIIAQTAYAMSSDEEEAYRSGCNGYISKPIKQDLLLEKLKVFTKNI